MIYLNNESVQFSKKEEAKDIKVHILKLSKADQKTVNITAYNFNPDNSFWRKIAILFGSNRRVVPISIEGQKQPFYVKIDQVAEILKMSEAALRQEINKEHIKQPAYINQLIKELYAVNLIHSTQLPGKEINKTLIRKNLNDEINKPNEIDNYCQKLLDDLKAKPIVIAPSQEQQKPTKKRKRAGKQPEIALKDPSNSISRSPPQIKSQKGFSNKVPQAKSSDDFKSFLNKNKLSQYIDKNLSSKKFTPNNALYLRTASEKISYDTMTRLISAQPTSNDKERMLRTFIALGKTVRANSIDTPMRVKRDKQADVLAFTLSKDHVFIELNTSNEANVLGKGTSKIASLAYQIDSSLKPGNQQIEQVARIRPHDAYDSIEEAQKSLEEEVDILAKFEGAQHIVRAHICQVWSKTNASKQSPSIDKLVLFQPIYTKGKELVNPKVPLFHKTNALIGLGKGITEMHKKGYVHMDVKPDNCLLSGDLNSKDTPAQGFACDLGLSVSIGDKIIGGTPAYLPPEVLTTREINGELDFATRGRASPAADSFSYGMTILAALSGKNSPPIDQKIPIGLSHDKDVFEKKMDAYFKQLRTTWNDRNNPEHRAKRNMLAVCNKLMQYNPSDRISCETAVKRLERIQVA